MAARGDIVTIASRGDGVRHVVADLIGSAAGSPLDARVVRNSGDGRTAAFTAPLSGLTFIETPSFEVGEQVRVGSRAGEVTLLAPGWARVRLDATRKPLKGGGNVEIEAADADVPLWLLTLENRNV